MTLYGVNVEHSYIMSVLNRVHVHPKANVNFPIVQQFLKENVLDAMSDLISKEDFVKLIMN